jgi:class 3 adenylate cyclase/tetratricopeptide (TPR) repeat protein
VGGPSELDRGKSRVSLIRGAPFFVGRTQELAWLEHSLQEAIAGRPRVVLIQGEAGMGKTRLLNEMRSVALHRGVQVCYGRCYEDLTLPYLPFAEALCAQLEQALEDVARSLGTDAAIIAQLLCHPGETTPAVSPSMATQADQEKLQLLLAVSRAIIRLAQRGPTLFVLDDLHWADQPSLELFSHLVFTVAETAQREPVRLLLIGTYRPLDLEERLARLIARLQRELICQTLTLSGLNESEVHELIRGLGLARPSHQLTATISEATRGNPLFIQEVLHDLIQQDALEEQGGYLVTPASSADLRLPDHVTGAIVARTRELTEGCRSVLTLAAFLGESFSLQSLSAVSGMSEDEVLSLLEDAVRQRLLLSEGEAFQFAHPLIRHVLYHEPSAARRQRTHRQIAQALARLYGDRLDAHLLEIGHHLVRAGPVAEVETVVEYARRAGDQAFRMSAWGDAARYYEAVLLAADARGHLSVHDRAELHYWAGLSYYRDQDVGPCLVHYDKAIESYRLAGDVRGLARVLMEKTRLHYRTSPYGTLIDMHPLAEVLAELGDREPGLRGHIMAIMSEGYRYARQPAKGVAMAQRALEIGQRMGDDRLCAHAHYALGIAQNQSLQMREGLENYQSVLAYARHAGDLWLEFRALSRMPLLLASLGRLDQAEEIALEACEMAQKTQDWANYSLTLSALVSLAVAKGDFAAAERHAHETMLMVSRSRYPWGGSRALLALACGRALRGAWAEAEHALDVLVEPGRVFDDAGPVIQAFARAFRYLLRAYSDTEIDVGDSFVADLIAIVGTDSYGLGPLCALVEIGDLVASPAMAEQPYQTLSLAVECGILFSGISGWMFLIPRVLGVAASLHRRWDTAQAHFQTAIDVATRIGAGPELGRTYLDYARMLVVRGRRGERPQAIDLVRQAIAIFDKLHMEPFARRAAQLVERLQTRIPSQLRPGAAEAAQLSEQEMAILAQIGQGRTNQEIAESLILSVRTVARHVRGVFNKIGVKSRKAAAAYALEKRLAAQLSPRRQPQAPGAVERLAREGATQALRIILVTDMEGSTALIQRLGDATAYELLRIHNTIIRGCLNTHNGTEVTHTGDGIEASFASAASAVDCAVAIQQAFARHNQSYPTAPIRVRIGLNAGEPIPSEGRLFGTAVHASFRICARAQPGQILVSDIVQRLTVGKGFAFVNRGRIALKGLSGRVQLYEVQWDSEAA